MKLLTLPSFRREILDVSYMSKTIDVGYTDKLDPIWVELDNFECEEFDRDPMQKHYIEVDQFRFTGAFISQLQGNKALMHYDFLEVQF